VVFLAKSEAEAATIVQSDPAVKNGIMKADLFPFHVALWSSKGGGVGAGETTFPD
jgi:hypothetical protein